MAPARGLRLSLALVMEVPSSPLLLVLVLGAWAAAPGSASPDAPPLVNEDVKRTVDLSSHLAKVTVELVLAHPGGSSTSRATSFLLALEPELEGRLAHLGVQVSGVGLRRSRRLPFDSAPLSAPEEKRGPGRWGTPLGAGHVSVRLAARARAAPLR